MTDVFIIIFFGVALLIGIWYTLLLLQNEMAGRKRVQSEEYDFGFGPAERDAKPRS